MCSLGEQLEVAVQSWPIMALGMSPRVLDTLCIQMCPVAVLRYSP